MTGDRISEPKRAQSTQLHEFWTDKEVALLGLAENFDDLADIAQLVLHRMSELGEPIIQICGPMSTGGLGSLEANMERFDRAIRAARRRGILVSNQRVFQDAMIRIVREKYPADIGYCHDILDIFYLKIFRSGYLSGTMFFSDWQTSTGAAREYEFAAQFGFRVEDFPMEWLEEEQEEAGA